MGLSSRARVTGGDNWGMGLLFVFFPDDDHPIKTDLFSSSSKFLRRSHSNPIFSKAQSTISICFLLVCLTFLLFTLSTFEPTISIPHINPSRRLMSHNPNPNPIPSSSWVLSKLIGEPIYDLKSTSPYPFALQGMGALFRRGTTAMSDLIVAHLVEDVTDSDLRLFLRLLHRSGLPAKSDLVLVFESTDSATRFGPVIEEENESFLRLIDRHHKTNATHFANSTKEPLWGKRRSNNNETEPGASYGSLVGFDAAELDPENSLSGFLAHRAVPMGLRRWACYPMLLGRVRRNFKRTVLADVRNLLILADPLGRVRNMGPDSVILSGKDGSIRSAMVVGGSTGVRRLAGAVVTEIAREAMQQRRKANSVSESGVLTRLAGNEAVLKGKGVNLVTSAEPAPDPSEVTLNSGSRSVIFIHRGNGNKRHEVSKVIMRQICALEIDSFVYKDC